VSQDLRSQGDLTSTRRQGSKRGELVAWMVCATVAFASCFSRADEPPDRFFETEVRPVLIGKCIRCHGSKKQSSGLRVDSRSSLIAGGDSGAAIVPGDLSASLLMHAVRREGDFAMPPDEELTRREIASLQRWIEIGAPWPESPASHVSVASLDAARDHWAFQPITVPKIPGVDHPAWVRTPVDAFVMSKLQRHQLEPSPPANRRALIRQLSYSLTGLPPTSAEVDRFENDSDPQAYEKLVERLLASPQYGEQWARHWLDVARYSDTKGYVYAREERFWVHAWAYRDWVTASLNEDMPYDRFLLLQLAADQIKDRQQRDLAAMGFLTLGRRFLGVERDIIDDRIDVVCRGTMGLTVGCARCHDHKYDPIPTADYYSLYGVFDSCLESMVPLDESKHNEAFAKELTSRQAKLQNKLIELRDASSARARDHVADYLFAQSELEKYPANGFDQIFSKQDLLPAFVRRWQKYLRQAERSGDPLFSAWHAFAAIPADSFARQASEATARLASASPGEIHPLVARAFATPPENFRVVCDRYGELFAQARKTGETSEAEAKSSGAATLDRSAKAEFEALRSVLFGPAAPCQVPEGPIVACETYFDSASVTELYKLQGEVDRLIINSKEMAPYALTLIDRSIPREPRIFVRGDPLNQGADVPRRFLSLLAGENCEPFGRGSGRLELAEAVIDPNNPLTARVIVNRVWGYHFGRGLVSTPSDFGIRASPPSHPELLDWLAWQFISQEWSLKQLHRWIVLSSTYRQSCFGPVDLEKRAFAAQTDPDNRLLWRMNARRLTFEELRDSLLAATDDLDRTLGGKPVKIFDQPYPKRRTLYGLVDRQYLPGTLRMFDFANPDLHVPKRSETTVPQQALFFMNHPLVLDRAKALASIATSMESAEQRVRTLFEQTLQRRPTASEVADALALVRAAGLKRETKPPPNFEDWQYGYGAFDEESERVTGFTPLPHFTGDAWQGGPKWPDAELGWVQLTATGGHPGNDRRHAAIRRWTACRDMTVSIQSKLEHQPTQGDGIRVFVAGSNCGLLHSSAIHHDTVELNTESIEVAAGDVIDFVVDIGDVLNSDQYLWNATIEEIGGDKTTWDSVVDFPQETPERLEPWEQLAQVLLCTNEFMFID
jgi:hypothetical protein